jgi:hypothetical protein
MQPCPTSSTFADLLGLHGQCVLPEHGAFLRPCSGGVGRDLPVLPQSSHSIPGTGFCHGLLLKKDCEYYQEKKKKKKNGKGLCRK